MKTLFNSSILFQIKMGRECINHYSTLHRFCVFSHDELVCKMAVQPDSLDLRIAASTYHDMLVMVDSEKKLRKGLLEAVSIEHVK
jgi:histone demethylase JARID1